MSSDSGRSVGRLVHVEPDPVAEPVAVVLAEPGRLDRDPRRRIDVSAMGPGPHGRQPVELRLAHERVRVGELPR